MLLRGEVTVGTLVAACAILVALAPVLAPAGSAYRVAMNAGAGDSATATSTVTAGQPGTLTLTPTSGPVGAMVTGVGTGFTVDTTCLLSAVPAAILSAPSCIISGGGNANIGFTVSTSAPTGSYTILVFGNTGQSVSAIFTVIPATTTASITAATGTTTSVITSTAATETTSTTKMAPPRCLVATVTFGSEVSPAVQLLRSFRDGLVLSTAAGSAFMDVFNAWYYSFSPSVAGLIAGNDPLRGWVRVILYPLLGILSISTLAYSWFTWAPELGVVMVGLIASSLIGLAYFTAPALIGMRALLRRRRLNAKDLAKVWLASLTIALALLTVGEVAGSFLLLAVASSAVVLTCVIAVPVLASYMLLRPSPK